MWKWIKRIAAGLGVALLVLVAVLVINTLRYAPVENIAGNDPGEIAIDDIAAATQNLSAAVQIRTVSTEPDLPGFDAFLTFLEHTYPAVHATMDRVVLDQKTPLYRWAGSDASQAPILLAAHYDVVPVSPGSRDQWVYPPYSGEIADGFVWGRGTLDDKGALIAILTAAEQLITAGFTPNRTIYFSFGGDEEVGGNGAKSVADYLKGQGVQLAWALDEGSFVLDDIIPGLDVPVASINLAEKGYVTLTLVARAPGGHSSMPPKMTAVGQLARAVDRLQNNPVPGGLTGVSGEFFDGLGRHFSFGQRMVFANRWLFDPLLARLLSGSPETDAMLRTTTAPTMLTGSSSENVLATEATAKVNFRIHPRDSIDSIVAHVAAAIDDDEIEIVVDRDKGSAASPVSSAAAQGYLDIESAIRSSFGALASVPGLTIAATDARHYATVADDAYRINPFKITGDDLERFHGINERLSIENLERGITFFLVLMQKQ